MKEELEISRRKALAAVGTVGVASVGAGFGTTAFFWDRESFERNRLVAGALDLKLEWQEHYSDGQGTETIYAQRVGPGQAADYVLPGGDAHDDIRLVFRDDGSDAFMAATSVEAFPDTDDDGVQDYPSEWDVCEDGADSSEALDPEGYRSDTGDTRRAGDESVAPLLDLGDVKPGDFGEVTFGLHLCDNPGYLWLFADGVDASENGHTEPEAKDPDEEAERVELLDQIRARAWYDGSENTDDGGNNRFEDEPLIVGPDSLRNVLARLNGDPGVSLDGSKFTVPTAGGIEDGESADGGDGGGTGIVETADFTCNESTSPNPGCGDVGFERAFKIDESALPPPGGSDTYTVTVGDTELTLTLTSIQSNDEGEVTGVTFDADFGVHSVVVKGGPNANICTPVGADAARGSEHVFEAPSNESSPAPDDTYAISHVEFCTAGGDAGNGGGEIQNGKRDCVVNSTTVYVGFEWWLPPDVGNEVQTDSVTFDLGFYSEQCRHNDGRGSSRVGGGGDS